MGHHIDSERSSDKKVPIPSYVIAILFIVVFEFFFGIVHGTRSSSEDQA
jgi:hypothetical protein